MALMPCDTGQHRYAGPSRAAYPALVHGADSERRHLRLCQAHFLAYLDSVSPRLEQLAQEGQQSLTIDPVVCLVCGRSPQGTVQVFLTAYPYKDVREDYWGQVCDEHYGDARTLLKLAP